MKMIFLPVLHRRGPAMFSFLQCHAYKNAVRNFSCNIYKNFLCSFAASRHALSSQYIFTKPHTPFCVNHRLPPWIAISDKSNHTFSQSRKAYLKRYQQSMRFGKGKFIYLFDPTIVDRIVSKIEPDLDSDTCVIEAYPGPGMFSSCFLHCGIKKLIGVEPRKDCVHEFKEFAMSTNGQVKVETMHDMHNAIYKNLRRVTKDSKVVLFALAPMGRFFLTTRLPSSLVNRDFLYLFGNIPVYLLMPLSKYTYYMVNSMEGKTSRYNVFYNTLFDVEILDKIHRKYFDPEPGFEEGSIYMDTHDNEILLVKILPKPNIQQMFGNSFNLKGFHHFVNQMLFRKRFKLIPFIDNWAPGGGNRLIAKGYTMKTCIQDLPMEDLVDLYRDFITWPELTNSPFLAGLTHITGTEHEQENRYAVESDYGEASAHEWESL